MKKCRGNKCKNRKCSKPIIHMATRVWYLLKDQVINSNQSKWNWYHKKRSNQKCRGEKTLMTTIKRNPGGVVMSGIQQAKVAWETKTMQRGFSSVRNVQRYYYFCYYIRIELNSFVVFPAHPPFLLLPRAFICLNLSWFLN